MKHRISKTILTIIVILSLMIVKPVSAANTEYSIIDLGTLGGAFSIGDGINDNVNSTGKCNRCLIEHFKRCFETQRFTWSEIQF